MISILPPSSDYSHFTSVPSYRAVPQPSNPRDRYLAAIARVEAAEAEYLDSVAREQIQKRRIDEVLSRRRDHILSRREHEEVFRRTGFLEYLYNQDQAEDPYSPSSYHPLLVPGSSIYDPLTRRHVARDSVSARKSLREQDEELLLRHQKAIRARKEEEARAVVAQIQLAHRRALGLGQARRQQQVRAAHNLVDSSDFLGRSHSGATRVYHHESQQSEATELEWVLASLWGVRHESAAESSQQKAEPQDSLLRIRTRRPESCPPTKGPSKQAVRFSVDRPNESRTIAEPRFGEQIRQVLDLFVGESLNEKQPAQRNPSVVRIPLNPTTVPTASAKPQSLKEQLQACLNTESEGEIRDTIKGLLESIDPNSSVRHPSTLNATAASPTVFDKGKGKAKVSDDLPISTSKSVVDSKNEIRNIQASFTALEGDFVFPVQLDFDVDPISSPSSYASDSSTMKLAYTGRNSPVRYYEQALNGLLTQLDAVDSFGDEEVRRQRREVVARIEKALEEVEREVEGRWRAMQTGKQAAEKQQEDLEPPKVKESAFISSEVSSTPISDSSAIGPSIPTNDSIEIPTPDSSYEVTQAAVAPSISDAVSLSFQPDNGVASFSGTDSATDDTADSRSEDNHPISGPEISDIDLSTTAVAAFNRVPSTVSLDVEEIDTFLLPASSPELLPQRAVVDRKPDDDLVVVDSQRDADADSDWSEIGE